MRLGLVLVIGMLAACQPAVGTDPSTAQSVAPQPSSPLPEQHAPNLIRPPPRWGMAQSYPALMYARPESDYIHMSMQCASRSRIKIRTYNPAQGGKSLYLVSGAQAKTFPAISIPGDGELLAFDDFSSEILLDTTNPILAAFRASGALAKGDPPQAMNASTPEELVVIEKFFADCEAAPN